jgi:hypothetical protein
MPNYLAEFEYRMNLRKVPELMFKLLSFRELRIRTTMRA